MPIFEAVLLSNSKPIRFNYGRKAKREDYIQTPMSIHTIFVDADTRDKAYGIVSRVKQPTDRILRIERAFPNGEPMVFPLDIVNRR